MRLARFLIAVPLVLAACGGEELTLLTEEQLPEDLYGSPTPSLAPNLPSRGTVYFIGERGLVGVSRPLTDAPSLPSALLDALLQGPPDGGVFRSAIPSDTRALGIILDVGVATVDLSDEFEGGGTGTSLALRVAQIVYTLTEAPNVLAVLFSIEGIPTAVISGSERVLDRPVIREDYARLLRRPKP
ncbi:MAG: GerMN domain-containing protein [Actinomycetota bacterium]